MEAERVMAMTKTKLHSVLPYIGIPVIGAAMLIFREVRANQFLTLQYGLLIIFGYVTAVRDVKTMKIPNNLILAMLAAWILLIMPKLFFDTDAAIILLISSALGFAIGGGLFLLVYLISRKGLGGGDVKFMAAAGLYLGYGGVLSAMLCGTIIAAITGLALILLKKINRKDPMPLAPFLYAGILITVFIVF